MAFSAGRVMVILGEQDSVAPQDSIEK